MSSDLSSTASTALVGHKVNGLVELYVVHVLRLLMSLPLHPLNIEGHGQATPSLKFVSLVLTLHVCCMKRHTGLYKKIEYSLPLSVGPRVLTTLLMNAAVENTLVMS